MAGTLTISTLSDGTRSTSSTNCIQGSAKAWVRFNSTSGSGVINGSYNVSSVTVRGTGTYTVNFTNALANANYSISGTASYPAVYAGALLIDGTPTTTGCPIASWVISNSTLQYMSIISAVFHD